MAQGDLSRLANLGPKSAAMLAAAGINDLAQLQALGAVRAWLQVKKHEPRASLNLLWALEGALSGKGWQQVAREDRLRLLQEVEFIQGNGDIAR